MPGLVAFLHAELKSKEEFFDNFICELSHKKTLLFREFLLKKCNSKEIDEGEHLENEDDISSPEAISSCELFTAKKEYDAYLRKLSPIEYVNHIFRNYLPSSYGMVSKNQEIEEIEYLEEQISQVKSNTLCDKDKALLYAQRLDASDCSDKKDIAHLKNKLFHYSAQLGCLGLMRLLVKNFQVDINVMVVQTDGFLSAFDRACLYGQVEVAEWLLDSGADITLSNRYHSDHLKGNGNRIALNTFPDCLLGLHWLSDANRYTNYYANHYKSFFEKLFAQKAKLKPFMNIMFGGKTVLHTSTEYHLVDLIKQLHKLGADCNINSDSVPHKTPMQLAVDHDLVWNTRFHNKRLTMITLRDTINTLLDLGANPDQVTDDRPYYPGYTHPRQISGPYKVGRLEPEKVLNAFECIKQWKQLHPSKKPNSDIGETPIDRKVALDNIWAKSLKALDKTHIMPNSKQVLEATTASSQKKENREHENAPDPTFSPKTKSVVLIAGGIIFAYASTKFKSFCNQSKLVVEKPHPKLT